MKKILLLCSTLLAGSLSSLHAGPFSYVDDHDFYFQVAPAFMLPLNQNMADSLNPATDFKMSSNNGFAATVALGYDFDPVRFELEYGFRTHDFTTDLPTIDTGVGNDLSRRHGDMTYNSLMLNLIYEADLGDIMFFYFGGGLGVAWADMDFNGAGNDMDTAFAFQFMTGFGYNFNRQLSMVVGYRYMRTTTLNYKIQGSDMGVDPASLNHLEIGLRFNF